MKIQNPLRELGSESCCDVHLIKEKVQILELLLTGSEEFPTGSEEFLKFATNFFKIANVITKITITIEELERGT